jgi:SRSO17 transposase
LTHVREVRVPGIQIDGVLADAAYGNVHAFRTAIDRMGLWYAVGVASRLTVQVTGVRRRCKIGRVLAPRRTAAQRPGREQPNLLNLPASALRRELVRLTRSSLAHRTALSGAEGRTRLDHFKGRSYRGWNHHALIAAVAFAFLQLERRLGTKPLPTFPDVRNWIRDIVAALPIAFAH